MSAGKRPFGVGLMSALMILGGLMQVGAGAFLLADRNDPDLVEALDVESGDVTRIAVLALVIGVIGILVGGALRGGAAWARTLVGIIAVLNVVALLWALFTTHSLHWYDIVGPTIVYFVVAAYLFRDEDAQRFFAR